MDIDSNGSIIMLSSLFTKRNATTGAISFGLPKFDVHLGKKDKTDTQTNTVTR